MIENKFTTLVVGSILTLKSMQGLAATSVNIGYHNPANSTVGLNMMWASSKFAFELGIGRLDAQADTSDKKNDNKDASIAVGGGLNGKYFFSSSGIKPYAQVGIGLGIAGGTEGAGAGAGGPYAGLGLFAGSDKLYLYVSGNASSSRSTFAQAGIGVGI